MKLSTLPRLSPALRLLPAFLFLLAGPFAFPALAGEATLFVVTDGQGGKSAFASLLADDLNGRFAEFAAGSAAMPGENLSYGLEVNLSADIALTSDATFILPVVSLRLSAPEGREIARFEVTYEPAIQAPARCGRACVIEELSRYGGVMVEALAPAIETRLRAALSQ